MNYNEGTSRYVTAKIRELIKKGRQLHSGFLTVCRGKGPAGWGWGVGYNDFNNLDMQTLWWLPNKILRHIHKERFSVFLSRFLRICNQSLQKVLIRATKIFSLKNLIWVSKNAEFHADFESVEKVLKKCTIKKLLAKMWRKKALFHFLLMFVKLFLLITFFGAFFTTFSTVSKSVWNSAFFVSFLIFFQKVFFGSY